MGQAVGEERNERDRNREEEQAIWEQLVASFDAEPETGATWPSAEDLSAEDLEPSASGEGDGGEPAESESSDSEDPKDSEDSEDSEGEDDEGRPPPAVGPATPRTIIVSTGWSSGPRDWEEAEDEDEGHFVPPPPPPLPHLDVPARFAWLAVLGGPLLLLILTLLGEPIVWWTALLGVGGFLGGFGTLVARMKDRDEDDEDPSGGAVV